MVISGEIRPRAQYFDKMLKFRKTSLKFCSYFAKHSQKIAEILHMFRKFRKTFAKCSHFDDNFGQISKSTPKMLSKCQYLQNFAQFSMVVLSKPKILLIPGSKRGNATIFRWKSGHILSNFRRNKIARKTPHIPKTNSRNIGYGQLTLTPTL